MTQHLRHSVAHTHNNVKEFTVYWVYQYQNKRLGYTERINKDAEEMVPQDSLPMHQF